MKMDYLDRFPLTDAQKARVRQEGSQVEPTSYNWQYGFKLVDASGDTIYDSGLYTKKVGLAKREGRNLVKAVRTESERQAN